MYEQLCFEWTVAAAGVPLTAAEQSRYRTRLALSRDVIPWILGLEERHIGETPLQSMGNLLTEWFSRGTFGKVHPRLCF
jgi:hypothetical protein